MQNSTDSSKRVEENFPGPDWDEKRRAKSHIKFAFDAEVDKPGKLTRAPTPYPKELKALAKHARNLQSVKGESNQHNSSKSPMVESSEAVVAAASKTSDQSTTHIEVCFSLNAFCYINNKCYCKSLEQFFW